MILAEPWTRRCRKAPESIAAAPSGAGLRPADVSPRPERDASHGADRARTQPHVTAPRGARVGSRVLDDPADRMTARGGPLAIAVIGAGIGGLTAAVALRQAGFDVDVYEQAPELTEVGGGINMGPNAARILYRLGFGAALDREAVRPIGTHQRRWEDGRTLQRAPLNPRCEELYGAPHLTVHRADLLAIIAGGFPAERIHLGHRLVGFTDGGDR